MTAYLVITVDVEEEGLWSGVYCPQPAPPQSLLRLPALAARLRAVGARVSWLVTYPAAAAPGAAKILNGLVETGHEVGSHLHPWSTPPFAPSTEATDAEALPLDLLFRKMTRLSGMVARAGGSRLCSFRGGRFHFGAKTLDVLSQMGYRVDSSVVPWYARKHGPDYWAIAETPYLMTGRPCSNTAAPELLEVPLSVMWCGPGWLRPIAAQAPLPLRPMLWRLMSGTGILGRLRPTFASLSAMKRYTRRALAAGSPVMNVMFHSSELVPGGTPYHRSELQVDAFIDKIVEFSRWAVNTVGCRGCRLAELHAALMPTLSVGEPN